MNWKQWKLGLLVSILSGIFTCFGVGAVVPGVTWKQFGILIAGFIAKDALLYLKQHPADAISFDTSTFKSPQPDPQRIIAAGGMPGGQPQPADNPSTVKENLTVQNKPQTKV